MDWIKRMNDAIAYIEENLDGEIDYQKTAKHANCSVYHFQRVFSYMAGASLAEYIRRRRLTLAAFDLQSGDIKVIDAAIKYGYESPTAFSRAFHALHSMTPSEAKNTDKPFTSYPPITFQITIKGVNAMNYRIEKKDEIRIVGVKVTTTMDEGKNMCDIPGLWAQCHQDGQVPEIVALINKEPPGLLGVSVMSPTGGSEFDYYIAAPTDKPVPDGMTEYVIPASQYAIFECIGPMPNSIQDLAQRILTEWLPTSGYEYGIGADMEVYGDGDTSSKDYKCEIWMPIVKK